MLFAENMRETITFVLTHPSRSISLCVCELAFKSVLCCDIHTIQKRHPGHLLGTNRLKQMEMSNWNFIRWYSRTSRLIIWTGDGASVCSKQRMHFIRSYGEWILLRRFAHLQILMCWAAVLFLAWKILLNRFYLLAACGMSVAHFPSTMPINCTWPLHQKHMNYFHLFPSLSRLVRSSGQKGSFITVKSFGSFIFQPHT